MEPNADQREALDGIVRWFGQAREGDEFVLAGLAGTGKTAMLPWLLDELGGADVRFACPTWKAADVLTRRLGGRGRATSVHNLIYMPTREQHGKECAWWTAEKRCDQECKMAFEFANKPSCEPGDHTGGHDASCYDALPDLVVIDEASMVDERMHEDLLKVPAPLLFVGDHGQLPPVSGSYSVFGPSGRHADARLERIMRQGEGSGIIQASRVVRDGGFLDELARLRSPEVRLCRSGSAGADAYRLDDWHEDGRAIMITPTNKRRAQLNAQVRRRLGRQPGVPVVGDRLMVLDNLRKRRIYNGQVGVVQQVDMREPDAFNDEPGCFAVVHMESGREWSGWLDVPNLDSDVDLRASGRYVSRFNNEPTVRWRWAYAVTCHKAQGSEWDRAVVDTTAYIRDPKKWLYTAVTRAKLDLVVLHR